MEVDKSVWVSLWQMEWGGLEVLLTVCKCTHCLTFFAIHITQLQLGPLGQQTCKQTSGVLFKAVETQNS